METVDAVFGIERQSHLPRWLVASVLLHLTVLSLLPGWRRGVLHPAPHRLEVTLAPMRLTAAPARPMVPQKPRVAVPAPVQHTPDTPPVAGRPAHPAPSPRRVSRRQAPVIAEQVPPAPHVLAGDSGLPLAHPARRLPARRVTRKPPVDVPDRHLSRALPTQRVPRPALPDNRDAAEAPAVPVPATPQAVPAPVHKDVQPASPASRPAVPSATSDALPVSLDAGDSYAHLLAQEMDKYKKYPPVALMRGWQGKVVLQLRIAASSQILGAAVVQSSGFDVLDQAAVAMARQLGHAPGTAEYGHRPMRVKVAINFRISDQ